MWYVLCWAENAALHRVKFTKLGYVPNSAAKNIIFLISSSAEDLYLASSNMSCYTIKKLTLDLAHLAWYIFNAIILHMLIRAYYFLIDLLERVNLRMMAPNSNSYDLLAYQVGPDELRIPNHIAMSFTNEMDHLHIESILRLLCWCKQLGIKFITLYDDHGELKYRQRELLKSIDSKLKATFCESKQIEFGSLNILSRSDGRAKFLEDVRILVRSPPEQIDLNLVQKQVGWPSDPELLISFGPHLCLYGFPPWPLRLTEIFSIPTHRNIPQKIFLDCLRQYSKTSQREGV